MKEPFYEQNWATCLRPTMAYIFKWKEAPCKYKVMMQWYMVQQLVLGSRILENTWLIHIFSTQKWFTDWRLLAPKNTDHLISVDHFGMKSKLLLCVCLGASSCNLASYAGALTSTTCTWPTHPNTITVATPHTHNIQRDFLQRPRYPNFKSLLVPTPPSAALN